MELYRLAYAIFVRNLYYSITLAAYFIVSILSINYAMMIPIGALLAIMSQTTQY
jgi:hypothetical protein